MRILKKITAMALAATVAAGAIGTSVDAVVAEQKKWNVSHINVPGAPSIVNYTYVEMVASQDKYRAVVTGMTRLANATVTVESGSEHKMSDTPLVFTATNIPQTWTLKEGSLSNPVQYKITAFTTIRDRLDASGYIERYTS